MCSEITNVQCTLCVTSYRNISGEGLYLDLESGCCVFIREDPDRFTTEYHICYSGFDSDLDRYLKRIWFTNMAT